MNVLPHTGAGVPEQNGTHGFLPPSASPSEPPKHANKAETTNTIPTAADGQSAAQTGTHTPNCAAIAAGNKGTAAGGQPLELPEAAANSLSAAERTDKQGAPAASTLAAGGGSSREGNAAKAAPRAAGAHMSKAAAVQEAKPASADKTHDSRAAAMPAAASRPVADAGGSKPGPSTGLRRSSPGFCPFAISLSLICSMVVVATVPFILQH